MTASLTLDFFHDVVCCWCFNISSRMRSLAVEFEFELDIRHRTFVLQASRAEIAVRWGRPAKARETILGHWSACRQASDRPELVDIEAMRAAPFDYPHGLQLAHLAEARNIADPETVLQLARDSGHDAATFARSFGDPATARAVEADRALARSLQVRSVPTLIVRDTGARLANGPREDLAAQLLQALG